MTYLDDATKRKDVVLRTIQEDRNIPAKNKELVQKYVVFMKSKGLHDRTINKNLYCMAVFLRALGNKDALKAKREDIEDVLYKLENTKYAAHTKQHIKIIIKAFYRHFLGEDLFYPKIVATIKTGIGRTKQLNPSALLTEEEVLKLIESANNPRDKAIIALFYDTGIRVGELLNMRVRDIDLDNEPGHIVVDGKTGVRRIVILFSIPYLAQYLNMQKDRKPTDYVWMAQGTWSNKNQRTDYAGVRIMLKRVGESAGLHKRIYPHLFRHSRASFYANRLTESQLKNFFGWTGDSRMAATYVHLSGRDVDNAVLAANGIKTQQKELESKLKVKSCPKCRMSNTPDASYCSRCGCAMSIELAMQQEKDKENLHELFNEWIKNKELIERQLKMLKEKDKEIS